VGAARAGLCNGWAIGLAHTSRTEHNRDFLAAIRRAEECGGKVETRTPDQPGRVAPTSCLVDKCLVTRTKLGRGRGPLVPSGFPADDSAIRTALVPIALHFIPKGIQFENYDAAQGAAVREPLVEESH